MKRAGIKRVTIELSSGAQIVMAPGWPGLPVQFIMPDVTGRIGKVIELSVEQLLNILADLVKEAP